MTKRLGESLLRLAENKGQLVIGDIEAEVINFTCLQLYIDNKNSQTDCLQYVNRITKIAESLFEEYNASHSVAAQLCVLQNMTWVGNYEFIKQYYLKNHNLVVNLHAKSTAVILETSTIMRYESGIKKIEEVNARKIVLKFSNNDNNLVIEILPSLTPKFSTLSTHTPSLKKYIGQDPDYEFLIYYDSNGTIEKFMYERKDTGVKYVYF